MNKEAAQELKKLTLDEIEFREKWRNALSELNNLVDPITKHNRKCCEFFAKHLPNAEEVVIVMDNKTTYKVVAPKLEKAYVEAYLPYGIDFSECQVVNVE